MEYIKAEEKHADDIFRIVQNTIISVYPKYYPKEVVDAFCEFHSRENIIKDINNGNVRILIKGGVPVGTGGRDENHITRLYVLPEYQGNGYGTFIMDRIEEEIAQEYNAVSLEASLPGIIMYEHRGYTAVRHEIFECENGVMLVYGVMEKRVRE